MAQFDLPSGAIVVPVGSRVTCNPPPTDTDEDYLVLVKDRQAAIKGLRSIGFEFSGDEEVNAEYVRMNETSQWRFTSLFFGDVNYIVTDSPFFFERFLTATHVCKTLNLLRKEDRIMVFEAIRGGSFSHTIMPDWKPTYDNMKAHEKSGAMVSEGITAELLSNVMVTASVGTEF